MAQWGPPPHGQGPRQPGCGPSGPGPQPPPPPGYGPGKPPGPPPGYAPQGHPQAPPPGYGPPPGQGPPPGYGPPGYGPQGPYPGQQPPKKSRTPLLVSGIAVVLVLVVGAVFGGIMLLRGGGDGGDRAELAGVPAKAPWGQKASITQADLQKVDPIELWTRMFKAQAMQPVWHTKSMIYQTPKPKQSRKWARGNRVTVYDSAIDFRTKRFSTSHQSFYLDDPDTRTTFRCANGKEYLYDPTLDSPSWNLSESSDGCTKKKLPSTVAYMTDGVNTGGLTAKQATAFVGYLLTEEGTEGTKLVTADKPKLVDRNGKQYIRLVAHSHSIPAGMQHFMWAFKETGLDSMKYAYGYHGGPGDGMLMIYYIDPATLLPAYAEFHATTPKESTGARPYINKRVEYQYGGEVPTLTVDAPPERIELTWPPEQL